MGARIQINGLALHPRVPDSTSVKFSDIFSLVLASRLNRAPLLNDHVA